MYEQHLNKKYNQLKQNSAVVNMCTITDQYRHIQYRMTVRDKSNVIKYLIDTGSNISIIPSNFI